MITRGSQTITWDVENRVVSVSENETDTTFVYDGDGNRVKKTENGETIHYVNQYYQKNIDTSVVTTYYYLGDNLVAMREGTTLKYMHQDHLTSTSVMTDTNGDSVGTIKYLPFGETRSGSVPTDKQFTGQRLDGTGLYYYRARYYDATIGRFISPDTIIPNPMSPQAFSRYSYCLNNPLKYVDPSGNIVEILGWDVRLIYMWMSMPAGSLNPDLCTALSKVIASNEFKEYDQLHERYSSYSEYLETSDELFIITSNNEPSHNELHQIENGATLLRIDAEPSNTDVYRYTPDGFWNFLTGGWKWHRKAPPIDWNKIGQKFADADWEGLGRAIVGTAGIVVGSFFIVGGEVLVITGNEAGVTVIGFGWVIIDGSVQWISEGKKKMPELPF